MAVVLATSPLHRDVAARLQSTTTLRIASDSAPDVLVAESKDAAVIIVRDPLPPAVFEQARGLRAVIRHGVGLDMIPVDQATRAGVLVANVPGLNARSVAEYVLMALLALRRGLPMVDRRLHRDGWHPARARGVQGRELSGATLGLVGTGHIGQAVCDLVSGSLGTRVLGHNRSGVTPSGIDYRPLEELLSEADLVVLACPLTEQTRGLMDAARLRSMKPGAALINVARGPVVDEDALVQALRDGHLSGAALDVFAVQPLPANHPLLDLDNVVLTPHIAGATEDSMRAMGMAAADAAVRVLDGQLPSNLVNPEALDGERGRGHA